MGLRQLHTAETMFIDDGLTDGAVFPPSSNAVYDALQSAIELPSVTTDDNGDVLTVVEGAWAKATATPVYDIVIKTDVSFNAQTFDESKLHLLKGSYELCAEKARKGEPINVRVFYSHYTDENSWDYAEYKSTFSADAGYNNYGLITVETDYAVSVRNSADSGSIIIHGASEKYENIYLTESGITLTNPNN